MSADPALGQVHGQDDLLRASSGLFSNIHRQFGVCSSDLMEIERSYVLIFFALGAGCTVLLDSFHIPASLFW